MNLQARPLAGAYLLEPVPIVDHRGLFCRAWSSDLMGELGLETRIVHSNIGFSHRRGTLRGLHFQKPPHAEVKVLRCTRGAVFDVIADLRSDSATFRQWFGAELTADSRTAIYVPRGFAQGYLTLADDTEICYHTSHRYEKRSATGVRYDDPAFGIDWPIAIDVVAAKDRAWPDYAVPTETARAGEEGLTC